MYVTIQACYKNPNTPEVHGVENESSCPALTIPFSDQEMSAVWRTVLFSANGNALTMHMNFKSEVTAGKTGDMNVYRCIFFFFFRERGWGGKEQRGRERENENI